MNEASFKLIIYIFFPILLGSTPLQERITNYSSQTINPFNNSVIETGLTFNSNVKFTSYSIYIKYWISSNLALKGKIAPYISKNDLYHYQYVGINYHSLLEENNYSPFSFNIGMHRLINRNISNNDRWFNFGIQYFKSIFNKQFIFHWNNYFTKDDTVKKIGINHFVKLFLKLNLNYGVNYYFQNSLFSLNANLSFPL